MSEHQPYDRTGLPALLEVAAVRDVTPRMRRVTFAGAGVADYCLGPLEDRVPNIKLSFPDPATGELVLPTWDEHGAPVFGDDPRTRGLVRTYTVRRLDVDARELDVDFVRHGDAGLASGWAERARPGDRIAALAGGGLTVDAADWYLLVADETGLPALSGIVEGLPAGVRVQALVEVADAGEEQPLESAAELDVRWLHRDGPDAGTTTLLQDAVAAVTVPDGVAPFAWVAAESRVARWMRTHLRGPMGLDRKQTLVIGYWRRGDAEPVYGATADHDRDFTEYTD